jgi:hypothetical protein
MAFLKDNTIFDDNQYIVDYHVIYPGKQCVFCCNYILCKSLELNTPVRLKFYNCRKFDIIRNTY